MTITHSLPTFLVHTFIVTCLLKTSEAAYRGDNCPVPCQCYTFLGKYGAWCNNTGITSIPKGLPVKLQQLDLSENPIPMISHEPLDYLINLDTLTISNMGRTDKNVNLTDLKVPGVFIYASANSYTDIPQTFPTSVSGMFLYGNHIAKLTVNSFKRYPSLGSVDLTSNGLHTIEPGTFDFTPQLTDLWIPFNKLTDESFPPKCFSKSTALQSIHLRFNKLEALLKDLPGSIMYLDYVGNHIKVLPSFAFADTPNMKTMEFWEGQVTTIEDNAFYGLSQVTILDFMQDKISSPITNNTFSGLTSLQTLYLDINQVGAIETGALRALPSITSLWMSGNNLTHLEPEVLNEKYITHLSELFIDGNPWYCDCHLRWLREKVNNATYTIQDPHLIQCAGPPKVAEKAWDELKPSDFVC